MKQLSAAIALALASSTALATNGYFTHGVGTHNKAQAGAGLAMPTQSIDSANNPAAAALVDAKTDLGLAYFAPNRGYTASTSMANGQSGAFTLGEGEFNSGTSGFLIPYVSRTFKLQDGHAFALSFYGRGGMNTDYASGTATFDPDGPGPAPVATYDGAFGAGSAGVNLNQAFLELSYAIKMDNVSIGAAPVFALQAFEAKGLGAFAGYTKTFAQSGGTVMPDSLTDNGHDYSYGAGFKLGAVWQLHDQVSLAFAYQSKISMSKFDDYSDLFAEAGKFDIPASTRVGLSVQASDAVDLHLDVEHTQFSGVKSVGNALANVGGCPTAGLGGMNLENCAGGDEGFGFGWSDMTTLKLGATWQPATLAHYTFRAGYSFGEQPISREDVLINVLAPGVTEQHFTAGVERRLSNDKSISVSLMYAPENTVSGPNLFDPTQTIELAMDQFELEVAYSF